MSAKGIIKDFWWFGTSDKEREMDGHFFSVIWFSKPWGEF